VNPENLNALLVIPCYRESRRIEPFLDSLQRVLGSNDRVSVLVVEDGSGAEEQRRMQQLVETRRTAWPQLRPLLCLEKNIGKGGAVYAGWAAHQGEALLAFADADGSCAAEEVAGVLDCARQGQERAVFASRIKMLGKEVIRDFHRHLLGRVYATIVSETLRIPVYDSQCGLKVVPRAAFEKARPLLSITGFAFDVELMCALLDTGCVVHEHPISWHETAGGKVQLLQDSWRMFRDVLAIRACRAQWTFALDTAKPTP
jgi:glycosyltransferase involved in cell wall biosynthesis